MNRGDIWGRWIIRQYLGGGGMGEVYLAMNLETSQDVALKRVRRSPGPEGEEKIAAERTGAELEQRLGLIDPRVTRVFWFGELDGDLAIEMEFIDGEDLAARMARGPLEPGRAGVIAAELCDMLRNLRGLGVIHGDLKPKNIRIDKNERVKVLDFGVAKALSLSRDYTASLFGSIAYCSPERLDTGTMDAHSDLWSVGVMLYQMVAGRLPFEEDTAEKLERRIRSYEPPPPLGAHEPEPLRRIVAKLLARDIDGRYGNETEAREDIERFLRGENVLAPAPAARSSLDATIRTVRPMDATIRTARPAPVSWPPATRWNWPRVPAWKWLSPGRTVIAAALVLALFVFSLARPQYEAWADTRELKHEIEAEQVNPDEAWSRYREIMDRKRLGIATWGISDTLKAKFVAVGDRPILDFRNSDYPSAGAPQWRNAVTNFSRAVALDPGDRLVKAKLRVCEGHLQRITASGPNKQQMLNEAAMKFEEASELSRTSPDPYLGMERLYAYSDPDRAQSCANQAEKCGHHETRREMAQLADGYLRRAAQTVRDAQKLKGIVTTEDEYEYWFRARQDFIQARQLYARVGSYGNAPDNLIEAVRRLDQVQARLREMDLVKQ